MDRLTPYLLVALVLRKILSSLLFSGYNTFNILSSLLFSVYIAFNTGNHSWSLQHQGHVNPHLRSHPYSTHT